MLLLFDIDLTLIDSGGVGARSMVAAGRRLHGPAFTADGIPFGGQLDPVILSLMLGRAGVEPTPEAIQAVRRAYHAELQGALRTPGVARPLAGVLDLLGALEAHQSRPALGLLTGNFEETGRLKLRGAGVDPDRFCVRVWGDDSPHAPPLREHLPPVGLQRYRDIRGAPLEPCRVTIIGDTPHDVRAARATGCRVLAVATGRTPAPELAAAGADRVVDDLSDTTGVLRWLMDC